MIYHNHIVIRNIYYMLAYALGIKDFHGYENTGSESFEHIHELFAVILSRGLSLQLKQGLYREYRIVQSDMLTVCGKIQLRNTIRNRMAQKQQINCEYDELSVNNLLNQILKTTGMLLVRKGTVRQEYRDQLKKQLQMFNEVNEIRLNAFMDESTMHTLYEKFILEYYRFHYPQLHPNPSQIAWALDDDMSTLLPTINSDITLEKDNRVLIIDAKFYSHTTQVYKGTHSIHSGNLYQIFTYVKNREYGFENTEHTVSGMLLYAGTDEDIQPDQTYHMHGNRIDVKTLNLNQDFECIAQQLNHIAEEYF